jgi:hypothetical protein
MSFRDKFHLSLSHGRTTASEAAGDAATPRRSGTSSEIGRGGSRSSDPTTIELSPTNDVSTVSARSSRTADTAFHSIGQTSSKTVSALQVPGFLTPGVSPLPSPGGNEKAPILPPKGVPMEKLGPFGFIEPASITKGGVGTSTLPAYSKLAEPQSRYKVVQRSNKKWYGNWSTRKKILAITGLVILAALIAGLTGGLLTRKTKNTNGTLNPIWRPAMESTWQIQLNSTVTNPSLRAAVYDVDLFDTSDSMISDLHTLGRRVICYFSAGTYESWRSDASSFPAVALGNDLSDSDSARYVDTTNAEVRKIMKARIQMAKNKGCDGLDPDHIDSYQVSTGFALTTSTGLDYLSYLTAQARIVSLAIGIKNSPALIKDALSLVDYVVNESCAEYDECDIYQPFISAGKPVFHIEYMSDDNTTSAILDQACNANGTRGFSTLIKKQGLGEWALDCPIGLPGYTYN